MKDLLLYVLLPSVLVALAVAVILKIELFIS
jgi:hypothetical protein